MFKKSKRNLQLVLANSEFKKEYKNCDRKEKNTINSKIQILITKYEVYPYIIKDELFELRNYLKEFIKNIIFNKKQNLTKNKLNYYWFCKNGFKHEYNYIFYTTYYLKDVLLQERIFHIINNIYEKHKCENAVCKNITKFLGYSLGYSRFCCIKCSKNKIELKNIGLYKDINLKELKIKKDYYKYVRLFTRRSLKKNDINPMNLPIGRNGSGDVYQIDHIISINYGFKNNISPEIIGDFKNLQLMHWKENNKKSNK